MKKCIIVLFAVALFARIGSAQLSVESVVGSHAGWNNWEKIPLTLELKDNFMYEVKSYNFSFEPQSTIRGRWKIDGDKIILTDLVGTETVLQKYQDEFYVVGKNGVTCMARFHQNQSLQEYRKARQGQGC
jgi:hypothetical protein